MQISNQDRRLTFDVAKRLCQEQGLDVKAANPAYGYIRLETPLVSGQTQYQFPTLQNQTYNGYNQSPTENRLALQDNFVVGSKFFGMVWYDTAANRPVSNLLTHISAYNLPAGYAFGNLSWLPGGATAALLPGYNDEWWLSGWMRYSFDYKVIIPRYDCLQHWYRPQTQATFNTKVAGGVDPATDLGYPWNLDQRDGLSDGFMPMEPNIVLSGAKNTEIYYNMPFPLTFADCGWIASAVTEGTLQPRLVVIYRGVLLQNTTNVK